MKKNINEYLVYGINNAISLFSSKRYTINSIILIKGGMAETHPFISSIINNKKYLIKFFEKKEFYQKYDNHWSIAIHECGALYLLIIIFFRDQKSSILNIKKIICGNLRNMFVTLLFLKSV